MSGAFIIDAARTVFGRYRGGLSGVRVDDLAALPVTELLSRHASLDPESIDDVIYGNTNGAGEENRNIGRMVALLAGLPTTVPGATVNRLCASGGEAIVQAARAIGAGDADLMIAGGVEGMTRAPFVVPRSDRQFPDRMEAVSTALGWRLVNSRMRPEWTVPLGRAAEDVAVGLGIGRAEMDEFALHSQQRAAAAWADGVHKGFAVPVVLPDGSAVERDESVRPDTTAEKLAKLKPAFSADGPVTAGNSSPLNDGAFAALVGTREVADRLGAEPIGEVLGSAVAALEPQRFTVAPVGAVRKLLARLGIGCAEVDLWEINEAFAAMVLSVLHELPEIDRERVNVHGGALAYGHPLGASMPRVIVDVCRHLRARGGGIGVATACIGVGQGMAVALRV
jgi:acetyl-CoA acetyltransferase family protein